MADCASVLDSRGGRIWPIPMHCNSMHGINSWCCIVVSVMHGHARTFSVQVIASRIIKDSRCRISDVTFCTAALIGCISCLFAFSFLFWHAAWSIHIYRQISSTQAQRIFSGVWSTRRTEVFQHTIFRVASRLARVVDWGRAKSVCYTSQKEQTGKMSANRWWKRWSYNNNNNSNMTTWPSG